MIVRGYDIDTSSHVEGVSGSCGGEGPGWGGGVAGVSSVVQRRGYCVVSNYLMGMFNFKGLFGYFHARVRKGNAF